MAWSSVGTKGTEACTALTPRINNGVGGVVICHGRSGVAAHGATATSQGFPCAQAFAAQGPTLYPDLAGATTWGNDASQTKLGDAITYLQGTLGAKAGKVGLVAISMGALPALNYALANPTQIAAIALLIPVTDLQYIYDNDAAIATECDTAYTNAAGFAAAVATHDPNQNTAAFVATAIPVKMWRSSDDTTAWTARQDAYATAIGCAKVDLGAVGHTALAVTPADVVSWVSPYLP